MKKITKDISVIVDALKDSSQLVVSPDGKKVKRLHPLPSNETRDPKVKRQNPLPSNEPRDPKLCTVVVENLPQDHSSENIQRIFGGVGSVKSVSVHDPNAAEDGDQSKRVEKVISGKIYALVEYETVEAAEKAVSTLNDETDWRNGLRVQLLSKRAVYGRKAWRDPDAEKGNHARVPVPVGDENNNHMNQQHGNVSGDEDEEHTAKERNGRKGRNRSKGRKYHGNNHGMGHGCAILEPSKPPPGPRMPDGTRGFTMGRGRPLSTSV